MFGQFIVLRHLDGAEHVGDARYAEELQVVQRLFRNARAAQVFPSDRLIEQAEHLLGILIVDIDDQVRVLHVVDPWHMLVSDPFDPVGAEAILQQRRALQCLADTQFCLRIQVLDAVSGSHGAGGTGGEDRSEELIAFAFDLFKCLGNGVACHVIMPHIVAHLGELVEDDAIRFLLQLVGLVKDFLHV